MIDYTTVNDLKAYGKTKMDAIGEAALLDQLVSAVSRKVDQYCHQSFSAGAVVNQSVYAVVDASGILLAYPPVPTISTVTNVSLRCGNTRSETALASADVVTESRSDGCIVRLYGTNYSVVRGQRLSLTMSYVGGWTTLGAVPDDFRWLVTRACWWEYKKREAPMEKTAIPEMGVVVIPQAWPPDLKTGFAPYMRMV